MPASHSRTPCPGSWSAPCSSPRSPRTEDNQPGAPPSTTTQLREVDDATPPYGNWRMLHPSTTKAGDSGLGLVGQSDRVVSEAREVWVPPVPFLLCVSERAPRAERIAPRVEAGSRLQVKLEVVAETPDYIALEQHATDREVLAGVRTVARDFVGPVRAADLQSLVARAAQLIAFDRPERLGLGVFQQTDEIVVVNVGVSPGFEAQGQKQVLPRDVAADDWREPLRVEAESVLDLPRVAAEVDLHAFRSDVDVPAAFDRARQVEADSHVDAFPEVGAHLAQPVEVFDERFG